MHLWDGRGRGVRGRGVVKERDRADTHTDDRTCVVVQCFICKRPSSFCLVSLHAWRKHCQRLQLMLWRHAWLRYHSCMACRTLCWQTARQRATTTSPTCCAVTLLFSWVRASEGASRRKGERLLKVCCNTERHGALLHASELQAFPSSTSQLVQPLLARLEAPQSSALAKNRRLAHLEVLEAEGFFSEEAMRTRYVELSPRKAFH